MALGSASEGIFYTRFSFDTWHPFPFLPFSPIVGCHIINILSLSFPSFPSFLIISSSASRPRSYHYHNHQFPCLQLLNALFELPSVRLVASPAAVAIVFVAIAVVARCHLQCVHFLFYWILLLETGV